jgi:hypothetical protein
MPPARKTIKSKPKKKPLTYSELLQKYDRSLLRRHRALDKWQQSLQDLSKALDVRDEMFKAGHKIF